MAKKLTGIEIFKLLPKTNCGECGIPTCMAFAMKLAQKNAELASCPYASDQAKEIIGAAAEPPIRLVKFGNGIETGNELVMFRHEKTFVHQTVFSININSNLALKELQTKVRQIQDYVIERVGEKLTVEAICINDRSDSAEEYIAAVQEVCALFSGAIILKSIFTERLMAAAEKISHRVPLLHALTKENMQQMIPFLIDKNLPSIITADNLDSAYSLASLVTEKGVRNIAIDIPSLNSASIIQHNTVMRKSALSGNKEFGFPLVNFITGRENSNDLISDAASCICKYSSLLVFDNLDPEVLLSLMMLRQNIYTDPQKPIQVEPGLYKIGEPTAASPLIITTNFSLTYFIVSGEIESSGVSAHLAIVEAEGMSVLTAWAAGKFSGEKIATFLKSKNIADQMTCKDIIIPGYVACISGELEENMLGWQILVGPQEASDIVPFLKRYQKNSSKQN